ncbi:MAG TPA: chemotaxis protein CheX [Acidimicrobiia bacterium]|nr:chemotaxis protein CheX [Acidimicrobiia bacterium]
MSAPISTSLPAGAGVAVSDWVAAMADASTELALSLGIDGVELLGWHDVPPTGMAGAYIPLLAEDQTVQLAMLASPAGCGDLSRLLLGMEPGEDVSDADVADAVGELVNIVAGGVKQRMQDVAGGLRLGLPVFINGYVQPTRQLEVSLASARIGSVEAHLMALRSILPSNR